MKNILIILIFVCVGFVSCDGRKSQSESLKESIEEFKDSVGPIEIIKYIPEDYAENVTDTILSNGFRIHIKTYTDIESSYLNEFESNAEINKHYYRNYIAEILISKNNIEIFKKDINNDFFIKNVSTLDDYFTNNMTMHGVWLNQSKSNNQKDIIIEFLFCKPETNNCYYFQMSIDDKGNYNIKEIDENEEYN